MAHEIAQNWFGDHGAAAWATWQITQNGVVRIVGHPRYPNTPGAPSIVARLLTVMCALPEHTFWADDISILGDARVDAGQLLTPGQVTDVYLLALAVAHDGQLATLDRKLVSRVVRGGNSAVCVLSG